MNKNTGLRIIQLALFLVAAAVFYIGFLVFQPFNGIRVNTPVAVVNKTVKHGDPVLLDLNYCIKDDITTRLDVQLRAYGGVSYSLFSLDALQLRSGCQHVQLPIDSNRFSIYFVPSGDYQIRLRALTKVNSIKNVTSNFDSEQFHYIKD